MLRFPFVLFLALLAVPARAQEVLNADDFQALSEGRTLHFTLGGLPFGSEQYFSDRRSLWRTPDGECATGSWAQRNEAICFVYELDPYPQCWRFTRDGGQVRAQFIENGVADPEPVLLDRIDDAPLDCPGPRVGS